MKFDVVIANPPYDRTDIQMKFASMAHDMCTKYSTLIIPAKWQCKGDKTKEKLYSTFRKEVVPHMSKICFYQESTEVFDISEASGITYYIADKRNEFNIKTIENRCKPNKYYNDIISRTFKEGQDSLNNKGQSIINKIVTLAEHTPYLVSEHIEANKYQYWCNTLLCNNCVTTGDGKLTNSLLSQTTGKVHVLGVGEVSSKDDVETVHKLHPSYSPLFTSDSMLEVASFLSYAYTKFVRFLIFNSICGLSTVTSDTWWHFVPDPVAFDHLFTDEELYKQYNLTPDEIAIIEGTIAERPFSTVWSWIPKQYKELVHIK